jgi:hypothetical protein
MTKKRWNKIEFNNKKPIDSQKLATQPKWTPVKVSHVSRPFNSLNHLRESSMLKTSSGRQNVAFRRSGLRLFIRVVIGTSSRATSAKRNCLWSLFINDQAFHEFFRRRRPAVLLMDGCRRGLSWSESPGSSNFSTNCDDPLVNWRLIRVRVDRKSITFVARLAVDFEIVFWSDARN